MVKSRAVGGTMVLWRKWIDPFVTIHPVSSSAFLPIILKVPDAQISIHIAIYLPTSGKEAEFVAELASLQICLENLLEMYDDPVIYIRGDGNTNKKNHSRTSLLNHFLADLSLTTVQINHNTYHHFTGEGKYDSNIDVLLHSVLPAVTEMVTEVLCKFDHPEIQSHHDIILSRFSVPTIQTPPSSSGLVRAPRVNITRDKILWSPEGIEKYESAVTQLLPSLRSRWLEPGSKSSIKILLQCTNSLLAMAAAASNRVSCLTRKPEKSARIPKAIKKAQKRLRKAHKDLKFSKSASFSPSSISMAQSNFTLAKKAYRASVRTTRLQTSIQRDSRLHEILSKNPSKVYGFIKSNRKTHTSSIQKLIVGEETYHGEAVADGFYASMTALKSCDPESLTKDPNLADSFSNYEHIIRICQDHQNIPPVSPEIAASLLKRLKKNVIDLYSITTLHYTNAGQEGLNHFMCLLNSIISEVNNATIEELNTAYGLILYKGHNKDKASDRAYRTISTCPFLAKALDLYLRDLYQDIWDKQTAPTQYQATGSSHELASLLVTEVVQYSLNVSRKPVYLLVLDAQSAFDRCLRQILCNELFKAGVSGSALLLINNRLASRSTIYEWGGEMMGPAHDQTGFEQGGINSGDYYKLYNNEQLKSAQNSQLGVDIGSSTISAIGQADDVILAANNIHDLQLLAKLTESYCARYRVKLVPSKTKLLPLFNQNHHFLVDYAKLINPVRIHDVTVKFVTEAEHVGVLRSTAGNMPNIVKRIAAHKKALASVCCAGLARGHRGNPAASLRAQQLYGTPVLFSGLASLVLNKSEVNVLENYFKTTLQNIQKLHQNTPRSVVYFLAGSLPGEALLHSRQLGLFSMICRLPTDPLNHHARHVLSTALPSAKSWFQQITELCLKYQLPHPLSMLDSPPCKDRFRKLVKLKMLQYWQDLFRAEAAPLTSLKYFRPSYYSLIVPHRIWSSAGSNPFESSKSLVIAKMISGRYRTEELCRFWSANRGGFCLAPTCQNVDGDLEHLLLHCPALEPTRAKLRDLWTSKTAGYPSLRSLIKRIWNSTPDTQVQFILDPCVFPEVISLGQVSGQSLVDHLLYLTRTFAFYLHKQKLVITGRWPLGQKITTTKHSNSNVLLFSGFPADPSRPTASALTGDISAGVSNLQVPMSTESSHNPPLNAKRSDGVLAGPAHGDVHCQVHPPQQPHPLGDANGCSVEVHSDICGGSQQPQYHLP